MKNVRPIRMNEDALSVDGVEGVPANMGPAFDDQNAMTRGGKPLGADSASVTSANHEEIICGHLSCMLNEKFNPLLHHLYQLVQSAGVVRRSSTIWPEKES